MLTFLVCAALTAAFVAGAVVAAARRRPLAAVRSAAVALIPAGLWLSGLAKLGRRVGSAVGDWATGLVFHPSVWLGFAMLGCSAVVLYGARAVGRRRGGWGAGGEAGNSGAAGVPGARGATGASNASAGGAALPPSRRRGGSGAADALGGEFGDIEDILKRHGI
jgi:hypothetical protein